METLTTGSLLSDQLIKALGNTLVHSLWQGILLAAAGGLIVVFTKKLSAALRYNLLIAAMLLFTCGVIFTFITQLQPSQSSRVTYTAVNAGVNLPVTVQGQRGKINSFNEEIITNTFTSYLNAHCSTLVLIWFLIICIKGIKLAISGYEVHHLKNSDIYAVSDYWESTMRKLCGRLKIKQFIRLVESGIAKTPMVIGHIKPFILIPVGFINALSAEEVEAILVHELAHICRRDYLVNLLQCLLEILFFFNPAVIWISQLIKAERENCCDDIALEHAGSKASYIQALVSCQEHQLAAPGLSMALARDKSKLLNRVKRMVNNHNQSLNIMEKTVLTICMVTAGLLTVAFSAKEVHESALQKNKADIIIPVKQLITAKAKDDTLINLKNKIYKPQNYNDGTTIIMTKNKNGHPQATYLFKRNEILYQVVTNNGKITSLYVNGQTASVSQYQNKIDRLFKEYKEVAAVAPKPPVPPVVAHRSQLVQTVTETRTSSSATPVIAESTLGEPPLPPTSPMVPAPPAPMVKATPLIAPLAPVAPVKPTVSLSEVTTELIKEGIIKDKDNFDININNNELEVDGVKQPEAVHQKILKKFVKKPGDKMNWHYSSHR
jgi:bla regulator protein BlaR1